MKDRVVIFWYRRDLRLHDNVGLSKALESGFKVLPLFIFDEDILAELPREDARVSFIYQTLLQLNDKLSELGSGIRVAHGKPENVFNKLSEEFDIQGVFANEDYEPYAIQRDNKIGKAVNLRLFKDQVVFSKGDVLKNDGTPYTVYTPYKKRWLFHFKNELILEYTVPKEGFFENKTQVPPLSEIGFEKTSIDLPEWSIQGWEAYNETRDFPSLNGTSLLGIHLRFGTVSVREILRRVDVESVFASELIWREFFMQIIFHFPKVIVNSFKSKYDRIEWRNDISEFEKWKQGQTGYPLVDAGMRELNATGHMHNRVRMVVASFLCKHLLIDWRWGEAYFAEKLLDFDLSANNGNWQWAAGCGCDAAPYFRVFNPHAQHKKFDSNSEYVRKWVPEFDSLTYVQPIVDHVFARERVLERYKSALS